MWEQISRDLKFAQSESHLKTPVLQGRTRSGHFPEQLRTSRDSVGCPGAETVLPVFDKSSIAYVQIPWRQASGIVTLLANSCTSSDNTVNFQLREG